jgi:Tol biopolymer transport system component
MRALVGTTLNHYRIVRELGSGGMGEVYVAEDLKLHRQVALKVLPAEVAGDPDRRQRFEREARAVAALSRPNIVTIYSVEQAGDVHFLTMELVEGKPLSAVITHKGLPVERILKLAIPLADAVSAAHQRGITHRDLKPANIMVAADGALKVLDFGLAKLREDEPAAPGLESAPTRALTGEGRIVGTVAYMSPEQAEGLSIDHRSDIFSLGIVLYEMATGERPFKGDTSASVLSSILRDTPRSVTEINRSLPRDLVRIIKRCLMKDPEHRYQSAKDLRNDLEEVKQAIESGEIAAAMPAGGSRAADSRVRTVVVAATGLAGAALAGAFLWTRFGPESGGRTQPPIEAAFTQLTAQKGLELFPSLSPDGKWAVYSSDASGNEDIYLQSVTGRTQIDLTKDSPSNDREPAFSPDGEQIAFRSDREGGGIFVMGRTGEAVRRLTDAGYNPSWSPNGDEIVFAAEDVTIEPTDRGHVSTLWVVKVASGEKRQIAVDDGVQPNWSPHEYRIAFWAARGKHRQRDILTIPGGGGVPALVTDDAALDWNPVWSPDGRYLYFSSVRGGSMNLWRVRIDESSGKTLGPPEPLTAPSRFVAHLSFAADGRRFAYASVESSQNIQRVGFDPVAETVDPRPEWITSGTTRWVYPDVSRDGEWLALASTLPQEDVFVSQADGTGIRQLTNDAALDRMPRWSPDGKRIAFYSNRGGSWDAWTINRDGSGLEQLTKGAEAHYPIWSPDGTRLAFSEFVRVNRVSILDARKPWESQKAEVLPAFGAWVATAWSPDGLHLAGMRGPGPPGGIVIYSLESRSYTQLTDFGVRPVWLNDGQRLLFSAAGRVLILNRSSKKWRELLSAPGEDVRAFGLSPDNRAIYLTRGSTGADIWVATLK